MPDEDDFGTALRDAGMRQAQEAQERDSPGWAARALAALRKLAEENEHLHVDDLRAAFSEEARHSNAFGPIWMSAKWHGWIEVDPNIPMRKSTRPEKHGHKSVVYKSLIWRGF